MQPAHQDRSTEHNTTPLVNKLDRDAGRETLEPLNGAGEKMRGRSEGKRSDEIKELHAARWQMKAGERESDGETQRWCERRSRRKAVE